MEEISRVMLFCYATPWSETVLGKVLEGVKRFLLEWEN